MTDIQIQESSTRTDDYKTLSTTNFTELVYELEKHLQAGYAVSEDRYPHFDFVLYEVHLVRNNQLVQRAKERMEAALAGRDVVTKEKRVENMAKARQARAEKRAAEGKE